MKPLGWFTALLLAAGALSAVAAGEGVPPGDTTIARAVQRLVLPDGRALPEAVNWLGQAFPGQIVLALVVALLLLRRGHRGEALLVAATLPLRLLNGALKALFDSPRPTADVVKVIERADGLGFPSGHASGAVLFYGAPIVVAPRLLRSPTACRVFRLVCGTMILLAGLSRVAVGAHWPSDVLGGFLWGGVLLTALLLTFDRSTGRQHPGRQSA